MVEPLIKYYFKKNFTYDEILDLLEVKHGVKISKSTLERKLVKLGLRRKNVEESSLDDILTAIFLELESCGYDMGYKSLWQKLKKNYGLQVKRQTVYFLLNFADPEGLACRFGNRLRRRVYLNKGPNYMWHCDGWDKLKQFGFPVHACVDGYSRFIVWLEVGTTNNNPNVIAHHFLTAAETFQFIPKVLRCDKGTENTLIGLLQTSLRERDDDNMAGDKSFIQGKSTRNQRIESFWGRMRKHSMDFYIQFFKSLQERNLFDGTIIHKKCLQYCFGPLIRYDLQKVKSLWNEHQIRKQAARNNVHGKPYIMFYCPHRYRALDYKKKVNLAVIKKLKCTHTQEPKLYDPNFKNKVQRILPADYITPTNPRDALKLYLQIINAFQQETDSQ